MTPPLGDILFFHILPRLPGKSVHRFLCVCKQWESFLTTSMFAEMHRHHQHKRLLIVLSTTTPCKFQIIDCESLDKEGLSIIGRPLPFEETSHENVSIIASVRGLVCVRITKKCNEMEYSDIILWNPLTGEYKTLSRPNNKECYVTDAGMFGLYYSCNDYKLLLLTLQRDVYLYSLKSDSWRKVETTKEDFKYNLAPYWIWGCWKHPCILLNEKLYFIVKRFKRKLFTFRHSIIMFDLKTEKLKKIATPFGTYPNLKTYSSCMSLTVVRRCIQLYVGFSNTDLNLRFISLWRMDGDGEWTNLVTYNSPSSHWLLLQPLHMMKNGKWIMLDESCIDEGFYKVDLKKHTLDKLFSYKLNSIIINPGAKYIETLGINLFDKH